MSKNDTTVNGMSPVTQKSGGTVTAFPDVCKTPAGSAVVPIPYPNIAKSGDLAKGSKTVKINGAPVCLSDSEFSTSTGDEAGSAKGLASGTTKGKAFPLNYSFDVKIEGKSVVRNLDLFIGNNRNTPPAPIMQAQPIPVIAAVVAQPEKKEPCPYCGKDKHDFSSKTGTNAGSGTILAGQIFEGKEKTAHPWYMGPASLQAHHLICTEAMDTQEWTQICRQFGYNINHKNNGVMLPYDMALACQLYAPLHRGGHIKGWADDAHLPYPDAVKRKIKEIRDAVKEGKFCDNPEGVVKKLDKISREILANIDSFSWTITSDGKDYAANGKGCGGVTSIQTAKSKPCPRDRKHNITHKTSSAVVPKKTQPLKTGE